MKGGENFIIFLSNQLRWTRDGGWQRWPSIKMMELNLSDLVLFDLISENPGDCPKKTW